MSKNSKKAWSTIEKLLGDAKAAPCQPKVSANEVAHQLLLNGRSAKSERIKTKPDRKKYREDPVITRPFAMEELKNSIATLWPSKPMGLEKIASKNIEQFGLKAKKWLLVPYSNYITTRRHSNIWKKAHVTALLKPGQDPSVPKNYFPSLF